MTYWKGKNVFVTGCTGFIGSRLASALVEAGANVVGLERDIPAKAVTDSIGFFDKINIIYGSVEDYCLIERVFNEYSIDTCFHLAAQSQVGVANRSPISTFKTNIIGTCNILEACRVLGSIKRIIIASSDKAYGEHKHLPYLETYSLDGLYPYDASKVCADVLSRCYFKMYKIPVGITRLANVYGGGDFNFNRIVPDTIRSLLHNRPPIIRSDGTYIRDYLYVKDAVRAYMVFAQKLDNAKYQGEVFNFGSSNPVKVIDLVKLIIKISGKTSLKPKILNFAKGEIRAQYLSGEKAKAMLNWQPEYNLGEGLRETFKWYKEFFKKARI